MRKMFAATAMLAMALLPALPVAQAQTYPVRPLSLTVPFPPGGLVDGAARIMAQELAKRLGQPVIVQNLPGAGGATGSAVVARAAPDGYALLVTTPAAMIPGPDKPYDPARAFVMIGPLTAASDTTISMFAPAQTAPQILARLAAAMKESLAEAGVANGFANLGLSVAGAAPVQAAAAAAPPTPAQTYAGKPVTLLVAYPAGGRADVAARQLAAELSGRLGQRVDVVNRPEPDGAVEHVAALAAKPDGLTIFMATTPWTLPTASDASDPSDPSAVDPVKSLVAIAQVSTAIGKVVSIFAPAGTSPPVMARYATAITESLAIPALRDSLAGIGATTPTPPPVVQVQAASKAAPRPALVGGIENLTYSEQAGNRLYFTGLQQGKPLRIVRTGVIGGGQWAIYSGAPGTRLRLQIDDRLGVRDILAIDQGQRITVNNFANERIEYRFYGPDSQFITASVIYLQGRRWYHGSMQTETFPGYPALQDVVDITKQVTSNTAPGKTDFAGVLPDLWPYLNPIRPAHAQAGGGLLDRLLGPAPRKSMTQRWEQLDDSTKYTAKMTANGLGILGTFYVGLQKSTPLIDKVVLPLLDEAIVHFPAVALGIYLGDKLYEWDKARQTPAQSQAEDFNDTVQRPRFSSSPMPEPPLAPAEGRYSSMFRSLMDRAAQCTRSGDMPCADNALLEGRIYADGSSDRVSLKNAYDRFYRRQTELVDEEIKKRQQKAERPPPVAAASAPAPVVAATPPPAPRPPPAAAPARQAAVSSRSDERWHRELTAETSHPTSDEEIPHRTDHVDIHGDDPEIPRSAAEGTAKMRGWTSTSAYGQVWDTNYSGCGDCPPGSRIVMKFWTTNYLKGQDFYKLVTVVFVRDR